MVFARVGIVEADDAHIARHIQSHPLEQPGQADCQRVVHADGRRGPVLGPGQQNFFIGAHCAAPFLWSFNSLAMASRSAICSSQFSSVFF